MKIAITAVEPSLDAMVEPRFGRSPYFLIVDTDTMDFEAIENPNVALGGGAGIQSAQLIANKGAEVILTGNIGPNAFQALSAVGIKVISGCSGTVRELIEQFKAGKLSPSNTSSVQSHFGMGGGMGRGAGLGMGQRRMKSMGAAQGWSGSEVLQSSEESQLRDELDSIKKQMQAVSEQIELLREQIRQLGEAKGKE